MLDIGWTELLLIGVVALIVVGPKDLPHLFHSLGRFTAKARSMAREFTSAMEDAAKGSGLDEASNSIHELKSLTSKKSLGLDALDRAADRFEKWDPKVPDSRGKAQRDPGADPGAASKPAGDGATAASAASAATSKTGTATGETETDGQSATTPGAGARRLHAVRRSDMKDD
ncbi:twin-arginine translocase subunit TatB [Paracoccus sp. R12_1]|uniref:Sec-independent protein translocase protein TatB n=1 Tax=unclassified Paracoccus (in: a-proteobacteria) TaxID=2688777 RepID=UPI001ADB6E41|nr:MULTISPECIES: Sec-independent protein translocase protein TatB [unclassified Paracoccus (in: a-proteobacteria)]MBO9454659.1 twin-arginine translocase subunit TatB [Paracoccus sp. R12_2]MBO9487289.1 twin-arginine translocase subunit TatB [Paracoccus sp. R12_1]